MKMFYEKDADVELIKGKKSCYFWLWKPRTCSCFKLKG
jgi:hypothetical protein